MSKRRRLQSRSAAAAPPAAPAEPLLARVWVGALLVFAAALAVRLLFWQATPGTGWPHSAFFKGDAVVWLRYALALERGQLFELGLPLRPPATAYLMALLWDGRLQTIDGLRIAWIVQGALVPALMFVALRRAFSPLVAWLAAAGAAASTALILLSTSLNNETPSLVLTLLTLLLFDRLRERPQPALLAVWSALQGLACLFRVEHVLFFAGSLALLAWAWIRGGARPWPGVPARLALAVAVAAAVLAPWHVHAWREVRRLNTVPADDPQGRAREQLSGAVAWDEAARARMQQVPAFVRGTVSAFVAATAAHRGAARVRAEDVALVLEEAFHYEPRPVAGHPFVAGYGPLNFALANGPTVTGGFDRSRLKEPPPLAGGPERYPPAMVQGLPPEDLALAYPPHLRLYNEGYSIGWRWMRSAPGAALALCARKLVIFWQGAALGATGYSLPVGLSGLRRAVDLVVPEGAWARAWRLLVLAGAAAGLVAGARRSALQGWLLFLLTKVAATVLFFGYARQGAMVVPVVLLLLALAAERWLARGRLSVLGAAPARAGLALLAAAVLVEAARQQARPQVLIDGAVVTSAADPVPLDVHRAHHVVVR
jgi:hypothetical protein